MYIYIFTVLIITCSIVLQAACGVTKKPKEQIVDIDAADANNELAAVEYIDDMYKFYKLLEVSNINHIPSMFVSV